MNARRRPSGRHAANIGSSREMSAVAADCTRAPVRTLSKLKEAAMEDACPHTAGIRDVTPSALGCEECLKIGSVWLHLRLCRACGHVGCCDQSPNRHATAHFHASGHPIIEGYDPPE